MAVSLHVKIGVKYLVNINAATRTNMPINILKGVVYLPSASTSLYVKPFFIEANTYKTFS